MNKKLPKDLPRAVRAGVGVLYVYAAYVLLMAGITQISAGWSEWTAFPRAILQSAAVAFIASRVAHRARWAWLTCVVVGGVWVVVGGGIVATLVVMESEAWASGESGFPVSRVLAAALSYLLIATAIVLLLQRDSRAAFAKAK